MKRDKINFEYEHKPKLYKENDWKKRKQQFRKKHDKKRTNQSKDSNKKKSPERTKTTTILVSITNKYQ